MRVTELHLMEWKGLQDEILQLVEEYNEEAGYGYTFDRASAFATLWAIVAAESGDIFVIVDYGQIKGFAIIYTESPWMLETVGNIYMFYIKPLFRNGSVSLRLLNGCKEYLVARNVKYAFSGSISRIDTRTTQGFERLLERFGFDKVASTFCLEVPCSP